MNGDSIYNGALDNASGIGVMLEVARALREGGLAPKRSIVFLAVTAEEQGLLGSEYYAAHPTFPAGKIAANINYDGGTIFGKTADLTFIVPRPAT